MVSFIHCDQCQFAFDVRVMKGACPRCAPDASTVSAQPVPVDGVARVLEHLRAARELSAELPMWERDRLRAAVQSVFPVSGVYVGEQASSLPRHLRLPTAVTRSIRRARRASERVRPMLEKSAQDLRNLASTVMRQLSQRAANSMQRVIVRS